MYNISPTNDVRKVKIRSMYDKVFFCRICANPCIDQPNIPVTTGYVALHVSCGFTLIVQEIHLTVTLVGFVPGARTWTSNVIQYSQTCVISCVTQYKIQLYPLNYVHTNSMAREQIMCASST